MSGYPGTIRPVWSWRAPCAAAQDPTACRAALAALPIAPSLARIGYREGTRYDVVFTRGDTVGRVGDGAALLALLGEIDTPLEAMLVALVHGHDATCSEGGRGEGGAFVLQGRRGSGCGPGEDVTRYSLTVTGAGDVTEGEAEIIERTNPNCAIGRRPASLRERRSHVHGVGSFFAHAAELEAASVPAFRHLARELAAHAAPREIVRACLRAADDEVRHARIVSALARRYGAAVRPPEIGAMSIRPLADVAADNAAEGCVRETFGALVAAHQAQKAADPVVRRALASVAADEARHAMLSWTIDRWAQRMLARQDRWAVARARLSAIERLGREVARVPARPLRRIAGLPDREASARSFTLVARASREAARA